ncbi:hypothetical protein BSKO_13957 [Bryopsis sp. KO-2023]|nr:hypothetical protein BSKO_13957 [Bryopsis sp. KO-2023]
MLRLLNGKGRSRVALLVGKSTRSTPQRRFRMPTKNIVSPTFYKRKLPCPPAIEFSSTEGEHVFQEALCQGTMAGFFKLIEQFRTQDEPAFCGLASLAMVLNALSIDPGRTWKGPWRWFSESLLDCCKPLDRVKEEGIIFNQVACLARCNGAEALEMKSGTFSIDEFRSTVLEVCRSGKEHIVVSYSRKNFQQTGDGHFSPIGGYHEDRDLVLILDTARFKYPPHWVSLPLLYEAMGAIDKSTGEPRGFMKLGVAYVEPSALFTFMVEPERIGTIQKIIKETLPAHVKELAAAGIGAEEAVSRLVRISRIRGLERFLAIRIICTGESCRQSCSERQKAILDAVRGLPIRKALVDNLDGTSGDDMLPDKLAILLVLLTDRVCEMDLPSKFKEDWKSFLDVSEVSPLLDDEVAFLKEQLTQVIRMEDLEKTRRENPTVRKEQMGVKAN